MSSTSLDCLKQEKQLALARMLELQRAHLKRFVDCRMNRVLSGRVDPSDIIQEVFIRAQQNLDNYLTKPAVPPLIWLRQLSHHVLRDTQRKQFRRLRNPCLEERGPDDFLLANLIDSSESVGTECQRRELAKNIRSMLSELSPLDREVLEMRHLEGYTIAEIAQQLELNAETVKKRYYRALERFRHILEDASSK